MEDVKYFTPNNITHEAFGDALKRAKDKGVEILAFDCKVTKDSITAKDCVEVRI